MRGRFSFYLLRPVDCECNVFRSTSENFDSKQTYIHIITIMCSELL